MNWIYLLKLIEDTFLRKKLEKCPFFIVNPVYNNNTFILKTTVLSASFEHESTQNARIGDENVRIWDKNARIGDENARIGDKNVRIGDENVRIETQNIWNRVKNDWTQ